MNQGTNMARDPVCGMTVMIEAAAASTVYEGTRYYFCSAHCAHKFAADPSQFVRDMPEGGDEPVAARHEHAPLHGHAGHEHSARTRIVPAAVGIAVVADIVWSL